MSGMKRRFDAVDPIVTTVMKQMTGSAAMHIVLLRVARAQDAFDVFGWTAASVYTMADIKSRFHELSQVLDGRDWPRRSRAVRRALFPFVMGALGRIAWAMQFVLSRLAVMDAQSDGDTDTEA